MNTMVSITSLVSATAVTAQPLTGAGSGEAPHADPIFAAIEAHRTANAEYTKAEAAADMLGHPRRARVFLGYFNKLIATQIRTEKSFTMSSELSDEQEPVFAYTVEEIERRACDLKGADRDGWIADRTAELAKDEEHVRKRWAKTKLGRLEAIRDAAYDVERDRMWDLIWTRPSTMRGVATLLAYCRANEGGAWFNREWLEVRDWNIETAICVFAGLPEPPMTENVAELAEEEIDAVM